MVWKARAGEYLVPGIGTPGVTALGEDSRGGGVVVGSSGGEIHEDAVASRCFLTDVNRTGRRTQDGGSDRW